MKIRRMVPFKTRGSQPEISKVQMLTRYLMKPSFPISQMTILNLRHLTLWTLKPTVGDVLNDVCAFCRWLQISRHRTSRRNNFFYLFKNRALLQQILGLFLTTLCRSVIGYEMTCLSRDSNPRQSVVEWALTGTFEGRSTN